MVAVAIGGAAIIGVGATYLSSQNAASAQKQAAQTASNTELNMYGQNQAELQPFITGGQSAYGTLNNLLGIGGSGNSSQMQTALQNIPGYQFTLNQGLESTQNGFAAQGLGSSGAALKGAATYATGLANSTYNNYVTNLQNSANTGASAASALAGVGTQVGSNVASNQIGAGNAAAAASTATGNAFTNGANNLSQYYTLNSLLNNTNSALNPGAVTPQQTF